MVRVDKYLIAMDRDSCNPSVQLPSFVGTLKLIISLMGRSDKGTMFLKSGSCCIGPTKNHVPRVSSAGTLPCESSRSR